ncbi:MAG: hypothetical protein E6Q59_00975 [Nitrosomonas sp.]|nr:MAG: hypothetical protein E6Q59_00975 [Nitrosomonas sp.]
MVKTDNGKPLWSVPASEEDVGKIARLKIRYQLLQDLISQLRSTMSERDPEKHSIAPPAEMYLMALELETRKKALQEMISFVDEQLFLALSNIEPSHPIKQRLKETYQRSVEAIIPVVRAKISSGISFEDLMTYLSSQRMILAEIACDLPSHKFGLARGGPDASLARTLYTVGGRFASLREAMASLVPLGSKDFVLSPAFDEIVGQEGVSKLRGRTIWVTIDEQKLPISTLLVCDSPPTNPDMKWLFTEFTDKTVVCPAVALLHTDAVNIPVLRSWCGKLFDQICYGEHSHEDLIKLIATLQWYLAHTMFYYRGSAAISEWLCRALFNVKGYRIVWSQQPDLQALLRPNVDDYVKSYYEFSKISPG